MFRYPPTVAAGPLVSFVGAFCLFGAMFPRWFSVLVKYPTDQVLNDYGVLALERGSLHSYIGVGWLFEVLIPLTAAVALAAAIYCSVRIRKAPRISPVLVTCGAVALAVVTIASITFEVADPRSPAVLGSDLRLGPGAIVAALSAVAILVGGVLVRLMLADTDLQVVIDRRAPAGPRPPEI